MSDKEQIFKKNRIKGITVPSDIDKVDNSDELIHKMGLSWKN